MPCDCNCWLLYGDRGQKEKLCTERNIELDVCGKRGFPKDFPASMSQWGISPESPEWEHDIGTNVVIDYVKKHTHLATLYNVTAAVKPFTVCGILLSYVNPPVRVENFPITDSTKSDRMNLCMYCRWSAEVLQKRLQECDPYDRIW